MKLFSVIVIVVLVLLGTESIYGQQNNSNPDVQGIWNGSVRFVQTATSLIGTYEQIIDVDILQNKVTGTHKYTGSEIIDNNLFGKTVCEGTGIGELHSLSINEEDSTYTFEVISPECNGTYTGIEGTKPYGPYATSIVIADKHWQNPDVLTGTETTTSDALGTGKIITNITWNFTRTVNAELIVTPQNYNSWLPEPGKDEMAKGSVMNISLKVQDKNGKPSSLKVRSFELRLLNTSKEPGITINTPINSADPLPDLRFLPQSNGETDDDFQVIEIQSINGISGTASIAAYDGGGWTTLTATAIMEDKSRIQGSLLVSGGITDIPIPKRNPGSVIATTWLNANGNPGEMDDKETSAGNKNNGDGLTVYEEYRGVISQGKFLRLDPKKKEIGVRVKRAELPLFDEALNWFKKGSDLDVILFDIYEIGDDRKLNKNFKNAHDYDQVALILSKGNLPKEIFGRVYTTTDGPDIPKRTEKVVFDVNNIHNYYQLLLKFGDVDPSFCTESEFISKTIAHELSHAVNIWHHGELESEPSPVTVYPNSQPNYHMFDRLGNEIFIRPYTMYGGIGRSGNQESGDLSCLINYLPTFAWSFRKGSDSSHNFYKVPLIPIGKKLCNSKVGTDFNAPPINGINNYFGNATKGNCLSQIKLKE